MESFNKKSVVMLAEIRREMEKKSETDLPNTGTKMVISGRFGPRGDGYFPEKTLIMTEAEAEEYHSQQIGWFAETEADMVSRALQFFKTLL
jgi:homocysteine S-methyltransferase